MNFLDRVIKQKQEEIAGKKHFALGEIERARELLPVRDFRLALAGRMRVIAEVKKKTPRIDAFQQTVNAGELAPMYEASGAAAVSIVTDEANFGTSLADARHIRSQVALPILVKDFFIDPCQIVEAWSQGADAILLITRILDAGKLAELNGVVHELGLSSLFEVHSTEEVERALEAGADIIGINNRDLDRLEVTLDTTRRLVESVPDDVLVISESGISRREEIEELSRLGVDAFLIGGALLASDDPAGLLRELTGAGE